MVLGLLPSIRGGLGELATPGQQTRLIDGYFKPYARVFEEVRYFSYLDETLERYTVDPAVLARVRLYPGRRVHPWLYAFYMPILYRREFREHGAHCETRLRRSVRHDLRLLVHLPCAILRNRAPEPHRGSRGARRSRRCHRDDRRPARVRHRECRNRQGVSRPERREHEPLPSGASYAGAGQEHPVRRATVRGEEPRVPDRRGREAPRPLRRSGHTRRARTAPGEAGDECEAARRARAVRAPRRASSPARSLRRRRRLRPTLLHGGASQSSPRSHELRGRLRRIRRQRQSGRSDRRRDRAALQPPRSWGFGRSARARVGAPGRRAGARRARAIAGPGAVRPGRTRHQGDRAAPPDRSDASAAMSSPSYELWNLGDRRVLRVGDREYVTLYSERVIRMLIERKGPARTPPYLTYKETRGPHFLGPLFRHLRARGSRDPSVLEVGCSFGHMTEYLAEQPEVASIVTMDTDPAFVAIVRAKVAELNLQKVWEVALFGNDETRRLPWRSEEHTSELQSLAYLVCRLLLEKKKKN